MTIKTCPNCHTQVAALGGRCPLCNAKFSDDQEEIKIPSYDEAKLKIFAASSVEDNKNTQVQAPTNSNTGNIVFDSSRQKTSGESIWEAIGILVGIALIIVGIVNMSLIRDMKFGADYYTYSYAALVAGARGLYGLYVIIGVCLVIKYAHKACRK